MERAQVKDIKNFLKQVYRKKNKLHKRIIFLDRDGTINKEGYLRNKKQIELLPGVAAGIRILNKNNITVLVVTNQPAIARGYVTIQTLREMNDRIIEILGEKNAFIDAIYSCPHHPDGEVGEYAIQCNCRKPGLLMFEEALKDYNEPSIVGMIGDQTKDIFSGQLLKIRTALVKTGYGGEDGLYDVVPDIISPNFLDAVKRLLS